MQQKQRLRATSNNDRFINATEDIKEALQQRYGKAFNGVGEALRFARDQRHPVALKRRDDLRLISETRNFIQHSERRGEASVMASDWTVELAEGLRASLVDAAPISSVMLTDYFRCSVNEKLHDVLAEMVRKDFSQAPVFENDKFLALFTTNAVARWVSKNVEQSGELYMDAAEIGEVLGDREDHEAPIVVRKDEPVYSVIERLSALDSQAVCVLVTDTGSASGRLMGMVTRFDLPQMYAVV